MSKARSVVCYPLRMDQELVDRINAHKARLEKTVGHGLEFAFSEVMRSLMCQALDQIEKRKTK